VIYIKAGYKRPIVIPKWTRFRYSSYKTTFGLLGWVENDTSNYSQEHSASFISANSRSSSKLTKPSSK
ncbi:MAG: hypothetical protein DMF60_08315, partial [Acidobacteria bacterium]